VFFPSRKEGKKGERILALEKRDRQKKGCKPLIYELPGGGRRPKFEIGRIGKISCTGAPPFFCWGGGFQAESCQRKRDHGQKGFRSKEHFLAKEKKRLGLPDKERGLLKWKKKIAGKEKGMRG